MTEAPQHPIGIRRSPQAIRHASFSRERKGWDTVEVREYLNGLADQIEAADGERVRLRAEIDRLRADVERARMSASAQREAGDQPDAHAVALFSQAQQVADRLIEEAVRQARDLMASARRQQRDIVDQAHRTAAEVTKTSQRSDEPSAAGYELPVPEIEHVRTVAQVAQVQLRSVLDALTEQLDRLGSLPDVERSPRRPDPELTVEPASEYSSPSPGWFDVGVSDSRSSIHPR